MLKAENKNNPFFLFLHILWILSWFFIFENLQSVVFHLQESHYYVNQKNQKKTKPNKIFLKKVFYLLGFPFNQKGAAVYSLISVSKFFRI